MANRKMTEDDLLPLTLSLLKEVINYDDVTGIFTWTQGMSATATSGEVAGSISKVRGYRSIKINKKSYYAHRLAWFYVYGSWPKEEIDHINGLHDDNRIINLRESSRAQNQQNIRKANRRNKSCGLQGVSWNERNKKWSARIKLNGKTKFIGCFKDPNDAHTAYVIAKRQFHEFCTI